METVYDTKRSISEIIQDLQKHLPARLIKQRKQGGATLDYIEWHTAANLLDFYTGGMWSSHITGEWHTDKTYTVRVAITIHALEDDVVRENIGFEDLDLKGYGDPYSNAYAMAFKRAAAMFGVARHLYNKEG